MDQTSREPKPDFSHVKTLTIREKVWRIFWHRPPGRPPKSLKKGYYHAGHCDHPDTPGKRIYVEVDDENLETLLSFVHETIHAAFPDIEDKAVEDYEADLRRGLRRMGAKIDFNVRP